MAHSLGSGQSFLTSIQRSVSCDLLDMKGQLKTGFKSSIKKNIPNNTYTAMLLHIVLYQNIPTKYQGCLKASLCSNSHDFKTSHSEAYLVNC